MRRRKKITNWGDDKWRIKYERGKNENTTMTENKQNRPYFDFLSIINVYKEKSSVLTRGKKLDLSSDLLSRVDRKFTNLLESSQSFVCIPFLIRLWEMIHSVLKSKFNRFHLNEQSPLPHQWHSEWSHKQTDIVGVIWFITLICEYIFALLGGDKDWIMQVIS